VYLSVRHLVNVKNNIGLRQVLKYLTPLEFYHRTFTEICSIDVSNFLPLSVWKILIFGKVTFKKRIVRQYTLHSPTYSINNRCHCVYICVYFLSLSSLQLWAMWPRQNAYGKQHFAMADSRFSPAKVTHCDRTNNGNDVLMGHGLIHHPLCHFVPHSSVYRHQSILPFFWIVV